jgi:hypothetical protein
MKNLNISFTTIILFAVGSLALSPAAQAVSPAPDGGYPGFNTAEGANALKNLTTGVGNTAVGWFSLKSNTDGSFNTALGAGTLLLGTGDENTATGAGALLSNTTGGQNTANGAFALFSNTEGAGNTADGTSALLNNTTGNENTAMGAAALIGNTTGSSNTAIGESALISNTEGAANTATGSRALLGNTTGNFNTGVGYYALQSNTQGINNTAIGVDTLTDNGTGSGNTAVGVGALLENSSGNFNTAIGDGALPSNTTGSGNTVLGYQAGAGISTAQNVIAIRASGENVDNSCYIGNIFGSTSVGGTAVLVNGVGKLGTLTSSKRFKDDIKPMDKASDAILALKPVIFRYKKDIDPAGTSQFGLVAEEVAQVNPDLVVRDKEGKPYTVRYDAVNAMLLNEFLKEHHTVQEQEATITQLKSVVAQQQKDFVATTAQQHKQIEALTASVKEQATQIQRVSAQIELNRFATERIRRGGPATQQVALKTP